MIPLNENPEPKSFSEKFKETASRMSGAFGGFGKMFGKKTKNEEISEENRPLFTTLALGDISPTKKGESISNITAKIYNLLNKENKENKKEYKKRNRLLKKEEKLKEKRHKQVVRALLGRQSYKVLGRIPKIKFSLPTMIAAGAGILLYLFPEEAKAMFDKSKDIAEKAKGLPDEIENFIDRKMKTVYRVEDDVASRFQQMKHDADDIKSGIDETGELLTSLADFDFERAGKSFDKIKQFTVPSFDYLTKPIDIGDKEESEVPTAEQIKSGPDLPISGLDEFRRIKFKDLSEKQKEAFVQSQAKAEGFFVKGKSLNIAQRHNNPGNIVWAGPNSPQAIKFGAIAGETIKGPDGITRTFARFPTAEQGFGAMKDLWERKYSNIPISEALQKYVQPEKSARGQAEMLNYEKTILSAIQKVEPLPTLAKTEVNDTGKKIYTASIDNLEAKDKINDGEYSGYVNIQNNYLSQVDNSVTTIKKSIDDKSKQLEAMLR
jgi:hypothetical protein